MRGNPARVKAPELGEMTLAPRNLDSDAEPNANMLNMVKSWHFLYYYFGGDGCLWKIQQSQMGLKVQKDKNPSFIPYKILCAAYRFTQWNYCAEMINQLQMTVLQDLLSKNSKARAGYVIWQFTALKTTILLTKVRNLNTLFHFVIATFN